MRTQARDQTLLLGVHRTLRHDFHPASLGDGRKRWAQWWADVLKTDPFPRPPVLACKTADIAPLAMEGFWPELLLSPDGRFVATIPSGLAVPIGGKKSGVLAMEIGKPKPWFLAEIAETAKWGPFQGLAAAWGPKSAAYAWHAYGQGEGPDSPVLDELQLVVVDATGQEQTRRVVSSEARNTVLTAGKAGFAVFSITKTGALTAIGLDATGGRTDNATLIKDGLHTGFAHFAQVLDAAPVSDGYAVLANVGSTIRLLVMDKSLNVLSDQPVDRENGKGMVVRLAANGKAICAAWQARGENEDGHLYVRVFDAKGDPIARTVEVAGHLLGQFAPAVSAGADGFALTYLCYEQAPNQLRTVWVGNDGAVGKPADLYAGHAHLLPFQTAMTDKGLLVLAFVKDRWPFHWEAKTVPLAAIKGE